MRGLKLKRKTVRLIKFIKDLIWIHNYQNNAKTYNLHFKVKKKTVRVIKFINDLIWKFENWLLFKKLKKKGWISKIKFFILFIIIRISISVTK